MTIESERIGDVIVLKPVERLDVTTAPVLKQVVERLFELPGQKILVDLEAVGYVSSIGLGACLRGGQLAQINGGLFGLSDLREDVRKVFEIAGLDRILNVHPTRAQALAAFESEAPQRATAPGETDTDLTLTEEIVLLAIQDEGGRFVDLPEHALDFALAGAVLMELCKRNRLDTDLERVVVIDQTPLGDRILDPVLTAAIARREPRSAETWIQVLAQEGAEIRERAISSLVKRGILERKDRLLHQVLGGRRYPMLQDREQRAVKRRVLGVLRSNEVPTPRDVTIVALCDACAVFDAILEMDEMLELRPRISEVAQLDLFAQAMSRELCAMQGRGRWNGAPEGVYGRSSHVAG